MRAGGADYSLPLFEKEVAILKLLSGVPGVINMFEYGVIKIDDPSVFPSDVKPYGAHHLSGKIVRINRDEDISFDMVMNKVELGWLPYIAMNAKNYQDSIRYACSIRSSELSCLPEKMGIQIAINMFQILSEIHKRRIVYLDHKPYHYFWNSILNRIVVIDWNMSRIYDRPLSDAETQYDIMLLATRVLFQIFTGRTAIPPNNMNYLGDSVVDWTYDDRVRLSLPLRNLIDEILKGKYSSATKLEKSFENLSEGG
jgi:serine/threonine protein kinase